MLDLKQIESFYPANLRPFKRSLLREYLQYKILSIIYNSRFGRDLIFMGGTAIRIVHGNTRFSEDLDFDNLGLGEKDFRALIEIVKKQLRREGYQVESREVFKGAYRSYLMIGYEEEKLLIQIDAEPQDFKYQPDQVIVNKFDVFCRIKVAPLDLLLAQKLYAIFKRPRPMGRDFYDAVFLMAKTKPDLKYLQRKLKIKGQADLKKKLLAHCRGLNFKRLFREVEQFLFTPSDAQKVLLFREYLAQWGF